MLSAIAGPDLRAPLSISESGAQFAGSLERDLRGVRVAWSRDLNGLLQVDPAVTAALAPHAATLAGLRCSVEEAAPDLRDGDEIFMTLRALSYEMNLGPLLDTHRAQMKDTVIWNIEAGRAATGAQIARAMRLQGALIQRVLGFFADYDFLALPVAQVPPFPIEQPYITEINGIQMSNYIEWMRSCYLITVTGMPAISVPAGFTPAGLPVGLQIVGRPRDELGVLQIAHAFEQATGFGQRRPQI